jgi:hypothetical protein
MAYLQVTGGERINAASPNDVRKLFESKRMFSAELGDKKKKRP